MSYLKFPHRGRRVLKKYKEVGGKSMDFPEPEGYSLVRGTKKRSRGEGNDEKRSILYKRIP
jgi:hypothetical protein